jgi:hypothetical protein
MSTSTVNVGRVNMILSPGWNATSFCMQGGDQCFLGASGENRNSTFKNNPGIFGCILFSNRTEQYQHIKISRLWSMEFLELLLPHTVATKNSNPKLIQAGWHRVGGGGGCCHTLKMMPGSSFWKQVSLPCVQGRMCSTCVPNTILQ